MTSDKREQIVESLHDKEYRDAFVSEEIDTGLPFQIRALRNERGWSQKELAERVGMAQEGVSRLESLNYGKFTLTTLKRLASAFDVALVVRFEPFSSLVNWVADLSPDDLAVPDFDHDLGLDPVEDRIDHTARTTPPIKQIGNELWGFSIGEGQMPKVPVIVQGASSHPLTKHFPYSDQYITSKGMSYDRSHT